MKLKKQMVYNYHFVSLSCTGAADERINIAGDATIQLSQVKMLYDIYKCRYRYINC